MEKKVYITPAMTQDYVLPESIIALSLVNDQKADPNKPVLTKEQQAWDIWGESAPAPQQ